MTGRVVVFNNILTPYTTRLYNGLVERGLDLAIVSASGAEPNRNWGQNTAIRFEHVVLRGIRIALGPQRFAYLNLGIFSTLSRLKPGLLVINGFYPSMLIAVLWTIITRTRLALAIDGWAETMPNSPYHRFVRPFVLSRCQTVITCGTKGRNYFLSQGIPAERIHVVPLVPAWDGPETVTGSDEREWDLLWCAHLNNDVKNASFLVALCETLRPSRPALKVRIVGQGSAQDNVLAQLRELSVTFEHTPSMPWHQMSAVFESAKLLIFPSLWEPWGLVCNEAMQCGVPPLVSPHVGAADDLVRTGDTGAVLPLDARIWAEEVGRLLDDPARWQTLSEHGRIAMSKRSLARSVDAFSAAVTSAMA
jgi:glycosyltransferase involved in cell wall biosynthesis